MRATVCRSPREATRAAVGFAGSRSTVLCQSFWYQRQKSQPGSCALLARMIPTASVVRSETGAPRSAGPLGQGTAEVAPATCSIW